MGLWIDRRRGYRRARPLFMGLIVGEVIAFAYWTIEPGVRVWLGQEYRHVLTAVISW